jgi:hypothetical protein
MDTAETSDSAEHGAPIIIRVKFKRSPMLAELRAVNYEADDTYLRAKDSNAKTIANFLLDEVAGWWVQPDTASISLVERMEKARQRVVQFEAGK